MKEMLISIVLGLVTIFLTSSSILAHCEIPCGIYDDELRLYGLQHRSASPYTS